MGLVFGLGVVGLWRLPKEMWWQSTLGWSTTHTRLCQLGQLRVWRLMPTQVHVIRSLMVYRPLPVHSAANRCLMALVYFHTCTFCCEGLNTCSQGCCLLIVAMSLKEPPDLAWVLWLERQIESPLTHGCGSSWILILAKNESFHKLLWFIFLAGPGNRVWRIEI